MKYLLILFLTVIVDGVVAGLWDNGARCPPVLFPNGKVRSRGKGKIIRFNCFEGFTLVGNKYSTCVRGNWDTVTPVCVNSQCSTLPTPEHALVASKYNGAILMYFCEPGYMLIGSSEIYCNGRQWNGTVPYCRDTTAMAPTKCDFESANLCWWEQDPHHDFDWRRHNFETPSSHIGTGPTHDHTLGAGNDGYYLYIEASGRLVNDTARIVSPLYNASLTDNGCFSFWYHMYGATIGTLRIYIKPELNSYTPEIIFEKNGNQGNRWINGLVDLPKTNVSFQLIIEGVRGSSYVSDLAVDDVAILQGDECKKARKSDGLTTMQSTINDNDQIEIVNGLQSCRGRCDMSGLGVSITTVPSMWPDACSCSVDCAENSICCPDFAEYCVLAINDTTNRPSPTNKIHPLDSSHSYTQSTQSTNINSSVAIFPLDSKDDIDPLATKPPLKISTTDNPKFINDNTIATQKTTKYSTTTELKNTTEKIVQAETPFIVKSKIQQTTVGSIETKTTLINQQYSTEQQIIIEYVQQLHNIPTFGITEIISIIVVSIACVTIIVAMTIIVMRRRKSYKRGSSSGNGSILSEDSDVRFLTSDEILDFNLARPNEYDQL